jgi:hypothetical protein
MSMDVTICTFRLAIAPSQFADLLIHAYAKHYDA